MEPAADVQPEVVVSPPSRDFWASHGFSTPSAATVLTGVQHEAEKAPRPQPSVHCPPFMATVSAVKVRGRASGREGAGLMPPQAPAEASAPPGPYACGLLSYFHGLEPWVPPKLPNSANKCADKNKQSPQRVPRGTVRMLPEGCVKFQ